MKKKIMSFIVVICLAVSLCACDKSPESIDSSNSDILETTETQNFKEDELTKEFTEESIEVPTVDETSETFTEEYTTSPTEYESTESPTEEESIEESIEIPTEISNEAIVITNYSSNVSKNSTAYLEIQGEPNTKYSISVYYSSGKSTASGLEDKTSDDSGYVHWEWKVGGKTKEGTYKISVSGGGKTVQTQFTVS